MKPEIGSSCVQNSLYRKNLTCTVAQNNFRQKEPIDDFDEVEDGSLSRCILLFCAGRTNAEQRHDKERTHWFSRSRSRKWRRKRRNSPYRIKPLKTEYAIACAEFRNSAPTQAIQSLVLLTSSRQTLQFFLQKMQFLPRRLVLLVTSPCQTVKVTNAFHSLHHVYSAHTTRRKG